MEVGEDVALPEMVTLSNSSNEEIQTFLLGP